MSGISRLLAGTRALRVVLIVVGVVAGLLLLLAAFPWGFVARHAAGPVSRAIGRPVTIGGAERVDHFSLVPTVALKDVAIAQPAWAGRGTMARIAEARVRAPLLPLLWGSFRPRALELGGVRAELRRTGDGRTNWSGAGERKGSGGGIDLSRLALNDVRLHLVDARRRLDLVAMVRSNARGLAVRGQGRFRDAPITLTLDGRALTGGTTRDYPARVSVASPLVRADATLRMASALALDRFDARVKASGRDLAYLDDLIEAGLFATQAFDLAGTISREDGTWRIRSLTGRIGRSRLTADATVRNVDGRTRLDGRIDAATLDFADFSSDRQRAEGAARARRTGRRVIPDSKIALNGLAKLDGGLLVEARRLLSEGQSPLRALKATVTLDRRLLTVAPLVVPLSYGVARGRLVVDDRGGTPKLTADLRIAEGATVDGLLLGDTALTGPLTARIRLTGRGQRLREAIAASSGSVGLVVRGGSMRRDYATFLGGDLFRSVGIAISGGKERVPVRCLVGRFKAGNGRLAPAPLVLDATIARGDGGGAISLPGEQIDLAIRGHAAKPGLLQSATPVRVVGTLSDPRLDIRPPRAPSRGKTGVLARVGAFLKGLKTRGDNPEPARPVDCARLSAQALG